MYLQCIILNISRRFIYIVPLVLIALVNIGCKSESIKTVYQEPAKSIVKLTKDTLGTKPQGEPKLIVYYFHGYQRCPTCFKLESYSRETLERRFVDELKSGRIEWKVVNIEEKGNEHFADDYKLYTKSVIVSVIQNNQQVSWKNLDKIWQLVGDQSVFEDYIATEVKACEQGKCL